MALQGKASVTQGEEFRVMKIKGKGTKSLYWDS